jgi:hypothetical protein
MATCGDAWFCCEEREAGGEWAARPGSRGARKDYSPRARGRPAAENKARSAREREIWGGVLASAGISALEYWIFVPPTELCLESSVR